MHRLTRRGRVLRTLAVVAAMAAVATPIELVLSSAPAAAAITITPGTPQVATITGGTTQAPWNTSQGDTEAPNCQSDTLPTYTPCTNDAGGVPNLAVYPAANSGSAAGNSPYPSGVVGTPGPLPDYCGSGSNSVEGAVTPAQEALAGGATRQPADTTLPFSPYYFPEVTRNANGTLTGYFDYRPKDVDEALVAATSTDGGKDWTYDSEALEENPDYCPTADTTDDGEGHADVIDIGGTDYLYTLERSAGDDVGVGLLVHTLSPTASNPINGLPPVEKTGIDPDAFATSAISVPTSSPGATIAVSQTGATGSPEQLVAGDFVDLTQTPTPTASSIIDCTGITAGTPGDLTGCTYAGSSALSVNSGDLIEQVVGVVSSGQSTSSGSDCTATSCTIPAGPNNTIATGGNPAIKFTVTNANNVTMTLYNANVPERAYVNGVAVYCDNANAWPTTKIEDCTTGPGGGSLTAAEGAPLTFDPIIPAQQSGYSTVQQTNGLVSPDGIVGVLPSYPGTPADATAILYTEKIDNYFIGGVTNNSSATAFNAASTINFFTNSNTALDMPAVGSVSSGSPVTVWLGDNTLASLSTPQDVFVPVTCTGLSTGTTSSGLATDNLTGCSAPSSISGTSYSPSDTFNTSSYIAAPGATLVPGTTLALTGEGSTTSAKHLFKDNEDLTVLRVAYTTDGVNFSTSGLANGGIITGADNGTVNSVGAVSCADSATNSSVANYTDVNNPCTQANPPSGLNQYASAGTADATEMRWVGSDGSIIVNPDGSLGLFLSGAWAGDGDSDAFNQIFYSSSSNGGETWSTPVSVISTDYTFSASIAQQQNGGALGVSAYYSGRAYGPSVVQNPNGTLTMIFAGYRTPKPIPTVGTTIGTGSPQYTVGADDPALYRNILVDTLSETTSPGVGTTTTVSASPASPSVGEPVTYTATVSVPSPGTGTPTGTVTFSDAANGDLCSPATLNEGTPDEATCTFTYTGAGSDDVTASYSGDGNYATSSGSTNLTINTTATTTTVSPSSASPVVGQSVIYTATVSANAPGGGNPTGTVSFLGANGTICSHVALSGTSPDTATCSTNYASVQTDQVTATYSGSSGYYGSSGNTSVTVGQASTTTALSVSPGSPVVGQQVSFTATVSATAPGSGSPTGTVTFTGNSGTLCSDVALDQSTPDTAVCTFTYSGTTTDSVTATYSGDTNFTWSSENTEVNVGQDITTTRLSASSSPVVGQLVTYTATVSANTPGSGTPTGTVTFTGNAGTLCSDVTLSDSTPDKATCTTTYSAPETDSVTATYSGDTNYSESAANTQVDVGQAATTAVVSPTTATPVVGEQITYTATVSVNSPGAGTPSGTFTFLHNGETLCSAVALSHTSPDTATCSTTYEAPGSDNITAVYSGDTNFFGSSGGTSVTIDKAATSTALGSNTSSPVVGQQVTYTATVSVSAPGAGTPTGSVTFTDNAGTLCSNVTLSTGPPYTASCSTTYTGPEMDAVTATYGGDSNFATSMTTSSITVGKAMTSTALSTTTAPVVGQSFTLTATVSVASPGSGTPTGTVEFSEDGTDLTGCSAQPVSTTAGVTKATCATSEATAATHDYTATYSGDSNFSGSQGTTDVAVGMATTSTAISHNPTSLVVGEPVTYTATVSVSGPGSGIPTGTVTFGGNAGTLCSAVALSDTTPDTATCSTTYTGVEIDDVTAAYSGDANFSTSTGLATVPVGRATTATSVSPGPSPTVVGEQVTYSAIVSVVSPGAGTPTGTVTFTGNAGTICSAVALSGDTASCSTTYTGAGSDDVTAAYSGDTNFSPSSGNTNETIDMASTSTGLSASPPSPVAGQQVTYTATVTVSGPGAGLPTGSVTFTDSAGTICSAVTLTGSVPDTASCATTYSGAVTDDVTAAYSGDTNFSISSASTNETIGTASTSTTLAANPGSPVVGQPFTLTATVSVASPGSGTPTGTVEFSEGGTALSGCSAQPVSTTSGVTTATCATSEGTATAYGFTATYSGDSNFSESAETTDVTVGQATTTTSVLASPSPTVVGEQVTYTATVAASSPGAGTPTGTVTFSGNAGTLCSAVVLSDTTPDTATCATTYTGAGSDDVTAAYSGDTNFSPSTGSTSETIGVASTSTALTASPGSPVVGQSFTLTATVSVAPPGSGTPTGTVEFSEGGTALSGCSAQPVSTTLGVTTATCATSEATAVTHHFTAEYSGDPNFSESSGTTDVAVGTAGTSTALSAAPSAPVVGQQVTYTATVSANGPGAGTPTGTVNFTGNAGTLCSAVALSDATPDTATCATTYTGTQTDDVTAGYSGDANFSPSAGSTSETIGVASTSTALTASPGSPVVGQSFTLTATVSVASPGSGTPTGTVEFSEGGTALSGCSAQPVSTTSGVTTATCATSEPTKATHDLVAAYSGDSNFSESSGTADVVIAGASTRTLVTSNANPSPNGAPVTFSATVEPQGGAGGTPTGSVTFALADPAPTKGPGKLAPLSCSGGTNTDTQPLSAGVATCSIPAGLVIAQSPATVVATYSGDANYGSSVSSTFTQTVAAGSTSVTVASDYNPQTSSKAVKFTATVAPVAPATGTLTGTVSWTIAGTGQPLTCTTPWPKLNKKTWVSTCWVAAGTLFAAGSPFTVTATYSGSANFATSSGTLSEVVNKVPTTAKLTTQSSVSPGTPVTINVAVTPKPSSAGVPTGTVTFSFTAASGTVPACDGGDTVTLSSGGASCNISAGLSSSGSPYTVSATYNGDANDQGSVTATKTIKA